MLSPTLNILIDVSSTLRVHATRPFLSIFLVQPPPSIKPTKYSKSESSAGRISPTLKNAEDLAAIVDSAGECVVILRSTRRRAKRGRGRKARQDHALCSNILVHTIMLSDGDLYSFNAAKSAVLVFGESPPARACNRPQRSWSIGSDCNPKCDSYRHLGILRLVSTSISVASQRCSAGRSAFMP